jgi:hypothetical protein
MSLSTYTEIRPWAKAIKERVLNRSMPPSPPDPRLLSFRNSRYLSTADLQTIVSWVDAGAPEGDPNDLPAVPDFGTDWAIGKPDLVIDTGTEFLVPSHGNIPQQTFTVSSGLDEDKWVVAAEIRPGATAAVHHIVVRISDPVQRPTARGMPILLTWVPGQDPFLGGTERARLLPSGWTITFEIHYTANGKAALDHTRLGLKFASTQPKQIERISAIAYADDITIAPGEPNHELKISWTAAEDVTLTGWMPHMHARGKDFEATIVYPDGKQEKALFIPNYDWHWQIFYELISPLFLPKGTRIDYRAHYDNSPNNKNNPDPLATVVSGEENWNEMMTVLYSYLVPYDTDSPDPQH